MARDLNRVMLIGHLTQDPETRTTPNGQTVATFTVATNRQWKDAQGAPQSQSEFHNVVAWRKLADLVHQYLRKARHVYVEGYLQTRSWTGQQDNIKRYRTEVVAENIIFLGAPSGGDTREASPKTRADSPPSPPGEQPGPPAQPTVPAKTQEEEIRIEDIPF